MRLAVAFILIVLVLCALTVPKDAPLAIDHPSGRWLFNDAEYVPPPLTDEQYVCMAVAPRGPHGNEVENV